jgi:hypothetical protein
VLTRFDREVAGDENDGGGGSVVDVEVSPTVLGVEEEVYKVQRSSGTMGA